MRDDITKGHYNAIFIVYNCIYMALGLWLPLYAFSSKKLLILWLHTKGGFSICIF